VKWFWRGVKSGEGNDETPVEGLIKAAVLVNGKRFIYPIPWRISEEDSA